MNLFYEKKKGKTKKHKKFYIDYIRVGRYALSMANAIDSVYGFNARPIVSCVVAIAATMTQMKIYLTYVKNLSLSQ